MHPFVSHVPHLEPRTALVCTGVMWRTLAALGFAVLVGTAAASPSPRVVARIPTGQAPCGAAAAFGSLWVANDGAGTLVRIDPRTNRVARRISIGRGACSAAAGFGAVWVTNYKRGVVVRVDRRTFRIRSVRVGAEPFDVLVAFGRVWSTSWRTGTLAEIDARTLRVVRRISVGPYPAGLTAAGGGVWVGFGRSATAIVRVDAKTRRVERVPVGAPRPAWFVVGTRDFWIQANDHDLLHVDPSTRKVVGRLRFGRTLSQGAAARDGTLWIPDKEQSVVYRVDPASEQVIDSFPAGRGAFVARRAFGSMWVTSYAGSDVWRFQPGPTA
jgi:streptogramin lyase